MKIVFVFTELKEPIDFLKTYTPGFIKTITTRISLKWMAQYGRFQEIAIINPLFLTI